MATSQPNLGQRHKRQCKTRVSNGSASFASRSDFGLSAAVAFLHSGRRCGTTKTPGAGDDFTGRAPMPVAVLLRLSLRGCNHLNRYLRP